MNLLFVCGATYVDGELRCASWITSIITNISDDFEIVIASPNLLKQVFLSNKRTVQMLPLNVSNSLDCQKVLMNVKPNVIVLFGTENSYTLKMLEACKECDKLDRTVVFAQGLCCVCARHYAEGIPERIIRRYTVRDILRRQNIAKERQSLLERAFAERSALQMTQHFIGRTTMDQSILRVYNQTAKYYKCNDILRNSFYEGKWKYSGCCKHRIFVSQYYYPLKGFHYLLEAAAQLKEKFPDLMIAASGYNPIQKVLPQNELKDSSYIRYIKSLIKKYQLQDSIELLGELTEERMKEEYLKANVFVMPSTIENSPNSFAEAMMLGVPAVAADVGGVSDFAVHRKEAYIYPSSATYLLAHYIEKIFCAKENVELLSYRGQERAKLEYNTEKNITRLESVFQKISGK